MIWPLPKSDKSSIVQVFLTDYHSIQSLAHRTSTAECKQMEEHSVLPASVLSV
jgi:hypothetical protein